MFVRFSVALLLLSVSCCYAVDDESETGSIKFVLPIPEQVINYSPQEERINFIVVAHLSHIPPSARSLILYIDHREEVSRSVPERKQDETLYLQIAVQLDAGYLSAVKESLLPWAKQFFLPGPHTVTISVVDENRSELCAQSTRLWAIDVEGPSHVYSCSSPNMTYESLSKIHLDDRTKLEEVERIQNSRSFLWAPPEWRYLLSCMHKIEKEMNEEAEKSKKNKKKDSFWLGRLIRAKALEDVGDWGGAARLWESLQNQDHEEFEAAMEESTVQVVLNALPSTFDLEFPLKEDSIVDRISMLRKKEKMGKKTSCAEKVDQRDDDDDDDDDEENNNNKRRVEAEEEGEEVERKEWRIRWGQDTYRGEKREVNTERDNIVVNKNSNNNNDNSDEHIFLDNEKEQRNGGGDNATASRVYLSLVMVIRIDDSRWCNWIPSHCVRRLTASLKSTLAMLQKYNISSEVILMEWNPAPGFTPIAEIVRRNIEPVPNIPIRIFTVALDVHQRIWTPPQSRNLTVHQFIAKNAAIRRARGEFILLSNPDSIVAPHLLKRISRRDLRSDIVYVTLRGELKGGAPVESPGEVIADYTSSHSTWYHAPTWLYDLPQTAACLDGETDAEPFFLGDDWTLQEATQRGRRKYHIPQQAEVWEDATGDFTLAARSVLMSIRGYTEVPTQHYIDGALVWTSLGRGAGQLVFKPPCGVLHQAHPVSELNQDGNVFTSYDDYISTLALRLIADSDPNICNDPNLDKNKRKFFNFNDENWGIGNEVLPEIVLDSA